MSCGINSISTRWSVLLNRIEHTNSSSRPDAYFRNRGPWEADGGVGILLDRGERERGSTRNDIGIDEPVALDGFPGMYGDGRREHRSCGDHRMELALLAARIDILWETAQKGRVKLSPGIAWVEPSEIDADQMGSDPAGDHVVRQRMGVAPP